MSIAYKRTTYRRTPGSPSCPSVAWKGQGVTHSISAHLCVKNKLNRKKGRGLEKGHDINGIANVEEFSPLYTNGNINVLDE